MPLLSRIRGARWTAALLSAVISAGAVALTSPPTPATAAPATAAPATATATASPSVQATTPQVEPGLPTGGTVLVSEDFSAGTLPAGWTPKSGTWTVRDGRLYGQGPAYSGDPTRLVFGTSVPEYRFDATVRFETVADAGRWAGLILDHAASGAAPWQHALMRANSKPVGWGKRTTGNDGWDGSDVLGSAPPATAPIAVGTDIRVTQVVRGSHGEWWYQAGAMTAPVRLAETESLSRFGGSLGFLLDGATVSFDDVTVTDLNPAASACRPYAAGVDQAAADGAIGDVVFAEDFSQTAGFDCWTKDAGWAVEGGELIGSSASGSTAIRFGAHLANYRLDVKVRSDGAVSLGADAAALGGAWTGGALPADALPAGRTVDVRMDVQGRTVSYFADGVPVGTETLSARSATSVVGIAVADGSVAVDDIRITKLAFPPARCIPADRVPQPGDTGLVIAHRGNDGNDGIADNLIPGYARTFAKGAEYWESDIHLTTDNVPVVRHDGIGSVTLAQFRERFPGLPTLEEVLQFQKDSRSKHVLEYKGFWTQEGATIVRDLLAEYGVQDDVITQSFDLATLDNVHAVDPSMPLMWLTSTVGQGGDPVAVSAAHSLLGINPSATPTAVEVAAMHAAGRKIFVWTRGPADFASLTALGVDGIITNDAGALVSWYASYNAELGLQTCRDVTVEVEGAGTAAADVATQAAGGRVTVTATPAPGHHLASLTGASPAELAIDASGTFTMPTQPTWVRAAFAANTWTIAYDANGGSGDIAATAHTFGDSSALAPGTFVRSGYEFAGWATAPDAAEAEFADAAAAADVTTVDGAHVVLYAVWSATALTTDVPRIVGVVKPGAKLTVDAGTWTKGAQLAFQWLADGEPIAGATGPGFHLTGSRKGEDITVRVTGTLGERTTVVESDPIRID